MTHEDFVTYEQAKALKELGFDWDVVKGYSHFPGEKVKNFNAQEENVNTIYSKWCFAAPSLYQAQKWLREKEIEVGVFADFDGELPTGKWVWLMRKFNTHLYDTEFTEDDINYDTYEQALSAGIDKALELLKQQSNGK